MTLVPRRALTLVEVLITLVIVSIILLGAQSAVIITAKAIPDGRSQTSTVVAASNAFDMMAAELAYATSFTTMNASAVVFTVPDRNSDSAPETVRYEWSGTAGAPLTRQYNGGSPVAVASNVQNFQLVYDKKTTPQPTSFSEGSEIILDSYSTTSSLNDTEINNSNWVAQLFAPSLPSDAVSWRVTRAVVKARKKGSLDGFTKVQIRPALNGAPTSTILAETNLLESAMNSTYTWYSVTYSNPPALGPSAAVCLVLQWASDADSCEVQYRDNFLSSPQYYMLRGSGSSSWNSSNNVLLYYVIGTVKTPNPTSYNYNLTSIRCTLQTGSAAGSKLNTAIKILNQPLVAGP